MTDFTLSGGPVADMRISAGDIVTDDGLDNAVLLSLFTDRRALESDTLPDDEPNRRGWWGDEFGSDPIGSRLWLLDRSKTTDSNLQAAKAYVDEALAWLVADGVARSVTSSVTASAGKMAISVVIDRVSGGKFSARYGYNWREKELTSGL